MPGRSSLNLLTLIEDNLHRNPLHHFDVVAGRILRRQQAEFRARGGRNAVDVRVEDPAAIGVDRDGGGLARMHIRQLGLFEIGGDPDVLLRNDRHQRLARLNDLSGLDMFSC